MPQSKAMKNKPKKKTARRSTREELRLRGYESRIVRLEERVSRILLWHDELERRLGERLSETMDRIDRLESRDRRFGELIAKERTAAFEKLRPRAVHVPPRQR